MINKELEILQTAVRSQDWDLILKTTKDILDKGPGGALEDLAEGFSHFASAKLETDIEKVISGLERAAAKFEGTDETFYTLVGTERLILLVHHDRDNASRHLRELGEFSLARYERTKDPAQARLAVEALEGARKDLTGDELRDINLKLMTAYTHFLKHSDDPGATYENMIKVCRDVRGLLGAESSMGARAMMNEAVACQGLASCNEDEALSHLEDSERLIREAITIFQEKGSGPEEVRARQYLANIKRDRAARDHDMAIPCLKEVIAIKEETARLYQDAGYMVNSGYEVMDSGVALMELSSVDKVNARAHLERAGRRFEEAEAIFQKEETDEELAQAKMGIGVVIRSLAPFMKKKDRPAKLKEAIKVYDEAASLFQKTKSSHEFAMARHNQAAALDDLADTDMEDSETHRKEAARLREEAGDLTQGSE